MPRREQRPQTAGHQALIKPLPLRPAVLGGYTLDDFTVDEPAGAVTCRPGVSRLINKFWEVVFGAACCDCPLRARCTTAAKGKTVRLHEYDRRCVGHADRPTLQGSKPPTGSTGRWSSDRSRG
jgi:hypothetical protein